ncbi:hypothetical protein C0992_003035 [Termitomyces sp. T32_za158]|nr:hypothetical protein C0992_003035 [Termitomyces sp. T32_za158]
MAPAIQPDSKINPSPPAVTESKVIEMRRVDNTTLVVTQIKVSLRYGGDLLAKDDGKWTPWSKFMRLELTMSGLYKYVFDPPELPHHVHELRAYRNWRLNNCLASSFLMLGLSESERNLADDTVDAKSLWEYLQAGHGGAGLVQQVWLLQEALTTNRSIISRDLAAATAATPYRPDEIRCFLENKQTLYAADRGPADPQPATLAARPTNQRDDLVCNNCKLHGTHKALVYLRWWGDGRKNL